MHGNRIFAAKRQLKKIADDGGRYSKKAQELLIKMK
jgi:hypothetical protein